MQYLKKEVSDEIDFLHADKHESLLQIDTMTLIGIVKHSQSSQNSKVTMSLQCIKKEVRKGVHFLHADEHQSLLFLMEVGNIFAKSVAATFVFYCDAKHSDILRGSSHVYCYLFPRTARLEIFCLNISI